MSAWDMNNIRKLAGLPVVEQPKQQLSESWDDGDDMGDEDPDVRIASEDKGQQKFETKNKKAIKTADKESKELSKKKPAAEKPAEKKVEKKAEPAKAEPKKVEAKKEEPKKDDKKSHFVQGKGFVSKEEADKHAADKKAEPAKTDDKESAEAKKRGRAHDPASKQGKAREWLAANANHTRGAFIAHMKANHEMSHHHANTMYYAEKKRNASKTEVKEVFFLQHPFMSSYLLAENRELNKMDWVDSDSKLEPMVFETEAEAQKIAKYMAEWKGQPSKLYKYVFDDEAAE